MLFSPTYLWLKYSQKLKNSIVPDLYQDAVFFSQNDSLSSL